jgi:hypothetical protein
MGYFLDGLFCFSAGFALRWWLTKDMVLSAANLKVVLSWFASIAAKSEVTVRREASVLLEDLKKKL